MIELVACPECGDIISADGTRQICQRCKGAGHLYRMLPLADLTASINQNENAGFHFVAIKRSLIRDALLSLEATK